MWHNPSGSAPYPTSARTPATLEGPERGRRLRRDGCEARGDAAAAAVASTPGAALSGKEMERSTEHTLGPVPPEAWAGFAEARGVPSMMSG